MPYPARRWNTIEKQHTCNGCGCVFQYGVDANDPLRAFKVRPRDVVATHPCPTCGLIQPEMVMWSKVWLPLGFIATLGALVILGACGMAAKAGPPMVLVAHIAVGVFVTLALVHIGTALTNPNSNLKANLAVAQKEVQAGKLLVVTPGTGEEAVRPPANLTFLHLPALLLLPAGALAFFYPICVLQGEETPPSNPGLSPAFIAPGDQVSYTFVNAQARGVTGSIWRGQPTVRVQNASAIGTPETLPSEGSNQQWGTKLHVSRGSNNSLIKPTIHFTVPKNVASGKTLRLAVRMEFTYPVAYASQWGTGGMFFKNETSTVSETLTVKVADPQRLSESLDAFLVGLGGGALTLLGSLWLTGLAWSLQLKASHSEVVSAPPPPPSPEEQYRPISLPADDDVVRAKVGKIDFRRRVGGGPSS
jgi:hypothetical protein